MFESLKEGLFREPGDHRFGLLHLTAAIAFFGLFAYYSLIRGAESLLPLLLGGLFTLVGIPEFLPTDRTTLAGLLRILGVVYALALIVLAVLVPSVL